MNTQTYSKQNFNVGEYLSNFLNESNVECFQHCVKDFTKSELREDEVNCMISCYSKYFYSYSNVAANLQSANKKKI